MAKRTPLYDKHVELGAKVVDFAGWDMPVRYAGDKAEHMAVREACGVFDVSHMGEVFLEGEGALDAVQRLFTNDANAIVDGQAMYAGMLNERGGFVDDCVIYRFSTTKFLVCVNAGNREKDYAHIKGVVDAEFAGRVEARDEGDAWGQLAVQGPRAVDVVASLCGDEARDVKFYHFTEGRIAGTTGIIARTGYTGEDGFELYVPAAETAAV
jgi:aminomethyltransferase